ncbi:hypothetical protein SUGI_0931490 [Cryptomeria japonica]|nr:hypothetical protein SUGI_0931490 [Cryptomeria japonica]
MGLSYTWGVSEGVLPVLIVNTALYVVLIRGAVTSFFKKLGLIFTFPFTCKKEAPPAGVCVMKFKGGCRENFKCIFCLRKAKEGQQISILPCDHAFHKACLDQWLQQHSLCPLCKLPLYQIVKSQESRLSDELQTLWL